MHLNQNRPYHASRTNKNSVYQKNLRPRRVDHVLVGGEDLAAAGILCEDAASPPRRAP